MAHVFDCPCYTVTEMARMLGMGKANLYVLLKKGEFPFPVIKWGDNHWLVPKKPVDAFFDGKPVKSWNPPWSKDKPGRPLKWRKGEYVTYNFFVPRELANSFARVCERLNERCIPPISRRDWFIVALEEFLQRREGELAETGSD